MNVKATPLSFGDSRMTAVPNVLADLLDTLGNDEASVFAGRIVQILELFRTQGLDLVTASPEVVQTYMEQMELLHRLSIKHGEDVLSRVEGILSMPQQSEKPKKTQKERPTWSPKTPTVELPFGLGAVAE